MFRKIKSAKKLLILLTLSILLPIQAMPPAVNAATASIYFDPASISAAQGSNINVTLRANTPSAISVSELNISYDPASLEYVSHTITGSPLSIQYTVEQAVGKLNLGTGSPGGQSTPAANGLYLATVTFRLLDSSGTSQIVLASNSYLGYSGASVVQNGATSNVSFTAPPETPISAPPSTPTTNTSKTSQKDSNNSQTTNKQPSVNTTPAVTSAPENTPATVAPSADTSASKVSTIVPLGFANEEIQIKIISNEPTKSIVKYGRSADALRQAANTDSYQKSYFVPLGVISKTYKAGDTLYYQVETIDEAGNKTTSEVKKLSTTPTKVSIFAKDKSGTALSNSTLIINGRKFTTDDKGNITLNGALPGLVIVSLKSNNSNPDQYFGEFVLNDSDKVQTFEVTPTGANKVGNSPILLIASLSLVILLAAATGLLIFRRFKPNRFAFAGQSNAPVFIGGSKPLASSEPQINNPKPTYHPETVVEPNKDSNPMAGKTLSQIEEELHSNVFSKSHTVQPIQHEKPPIDTKDLPK